MIIDEVSGHPDWSRHHTPAMYGFESYISLPILLDDGSFYGTLCAIDPRPHKLSAPTLVDRMQELARQVAELLSAEGRMAR